MFMSFLNIENRARCEIGFKLSFIVEVDFKNKVLTIFSFRFQDFLIKLLIVLKMLPSKLLLIDTFLLLF